MRLTAPMTLLAALAAAGTLPAQEVTDEAAPSSARAAAPRPNIVFILADDHARNAFGAYGAEPGVTPRLDALAAAGVRFEQAFVGNSICAPARATILTGLHSHANGVVDNRAEFDGSQRTHPKMLRAAGYQTAMIGKWHLKSDPTGFDHWEVLHGQGPYYNPVLKTPDGDVRHHGYTTDVISDRAVAWLEEERDADRPFLLCVQHKAPHRNWQPALRHLDLLADEVVPEPPTLFDDGATRAAGFHEQAMTIARHMYPSDLKLGGPPKRLDEEQAAAWTAAYGPRNEAFRAAGLEGRALTRWKFQRYLKDYLRCVHAMDEGIGRVLDALDAAGLAENTLVVYCSDQGFFLGEHGWYDKRWLYEESAGFPLVMRWPGVIEPGTVEERLVQNVDLAPTLLAAAGVEVPADMHGRSLLPLLRGEEPDDWRDAIYYRYYESYGPHDVPAHSGVRSTYDKLIHYPALDAWEYFDLRSDPHELHNRYGEAEVQERVEELRARLTALRERFGDTAD